MGTLFPLCKTSRAAPPTKVSRTPADQKGVVLRLLTLVLALGGGGLAQQYSFRHYGAAEGLQNLASLAAPSSAAPSR